MKARSSILIIEDEPPIRDLIKRILKKKEYFVSEAKSVATALRQLKKKKFDLILLDLTLPDGSGLDILEKISTSYKNRVIIVSGTGTIDAAVEAMRKGAFEFLKKPCDHNILLETVKKALELNQKLDDYQKLKGNLGDKETLQVEYLKSEISRYNDIVNNQNKMIRVLKEKNKQLSENKQAFKDIEKYRSICGAVAHSLKGEFTHIGYASKEIRELMRCSQEIQEECDTIERSVKYCAIMMRRLLDYLDTGKSPTESVSPLVLLRKTELLVMPRLSSNIKLEITTGQEMKEQTISANLEQLMGVILELINNAAKALHKNGGTIGLNAEERTNEIAIYVKDDGPGIPVKLRKQLLKKQVSSKSGLGLGIFLCNKVVQELGGKLKLYETSKKGTTFMILFPKTSNKKEL